MAKVVDHVARKVATVIVKAIKRMAAMRGDIPFFVIPILIFSYLFK